MVSKMRTSYCLFQYSNFIRTRILRSSFKNNLCIFPHSNPSQQHQKRYLIHTIPKCTASEQPGTEQPDHQEKQISENPIIPSHNNTTPSPEDLLAAFESALDDIEDEAEKKQSPSNEKGRKEEEKYKAHLRRLEILSSLPSDLVVAPIQNKCTGCGTIIQSNNSNKPGFIPTDVLTERDAKTMKEIETEEGIKFVEVSKPDLICQRCYRLKYYGSIESHLRVSTNKEEKNELNLKSTNNNIGNELTPQKFRQCLEQLRGLNAVIIYLIDIFDFHGTIIPSLREIIGSKNPIIVAVNKTDLLPRDYKPNRVESWISHECKSIGLHNINGIHMISSTKGKGVNTLLADAMRLAKRNCSDIYVVGAANVGKSSFINQLMELKKSNKNRIRNDDNNKKGNKKTKSFGSLTTSVIPGTTLDVIRIPLGHKLNLYDTPGLMIPHQLTNNLNAEELRVVLPTKSVNKITYRLQEGKALYIGGLARIEMLTGRAYFFTCFFSSMVKVHPGKIENAEEFTNKHVGELLTPPFNNERYKQLGEWSNKTFTTKGFGWKKASLDIVLSGLGWISLTGVGDIKIRICVPKEMGVFTREPLMPYELKDGASKYTGAIGINKREMKKKWIR